MKFHLIDKCQRRFSRADGEWWEWEHLIRDLEAVGLEKTYMALVASGKEGERMETTEECLNDVWERYRVKREMDEVYVGVVRVGGGELADEEGGGG